jgi:hypothetical protein
MDWTVRVRFPRETTDYLVQNVQIASEANPPFRSKVIGAKAAEGVKVTPRTSIGKE